MENDDVLIIGAGVAGLSTAYHLGVRGVDSVTVLEKEDVPGAHASGRSAGMIHHYHPQERMRTVLEHAIRRLKVYDFRKSEEVCREVPSLWLFPGETLAALREIGTDQGRWQRVSPGSVPEELKPEDVSRPHCWVSCTEDGLVHPDRLISELVKDLRDMGIGVLTNHRVTGGERTGGGWIVETTEGPFRGRYTVDAAGAWAERIGERFGSDSPDLVPESRHLFVVEEKILEGLPFGYYWDRVHDVYFRSMTEGTLVSVCDSVAGPPGEAPADVDPDRMLAERLLSAYPQFREIKIQNHWSGQRTFAGDRLPVLRADPERPGLIWSAGLGGHGLTASMWVGCRTADLVCSSTTKTRISTR